MWNRRHRWIGRLAVGLAFAAVAVPTAQARIVECRFYGGMSVDETAEALEISPATVKRDWTLARAWLNKELGA